MIVAIITNKAGLSLALGAFLAGMIVSETGYGYQAGSFEINFTIWLEYIIIKGVATIEITAIVINNEF